VYAGAPDVGVSALPVFPDRSGTVATWPALVVALCSVHRPPDNPDTADVYQLGHTHTLVVAVHPGLAVKVSVEADPFPSVVLTELAAVENVTLVALWETIVGAAIVPEIVADPVPSPVPTIVRLDATLPLAGITSVFCAVIVGGDPHPEEPPEPDPPEDDPPELDPPLDDPPEDEPPELDPPLEEPPLDPPELDDATGVVRCTSETVPPT
jgi:hypothetical protein